MKLKYFLTSAIVALSAFISCDKLDEVPDNRTVIDSPEKVRLLLTSGYPQAIPAVICELSGDNMLDDNVVVPLTHNGANQNFHEEAYQWKDITNYSIDSDDTPYSVWQEYYAGISVCNHAIEAMQDMSDDPASDPLLSAQWGEAHVLRAYLHFVLVNVFAESYKNATDSKADRGIPYVTRPETTVQVDYSNSEYLHDVATTYDLIEKDLLEGIKLIDDGLYKVPAYHFNRNATSAFAARFFLFKRDYEKCLKYANDALGENPSTMLRKWGSLNQNTPYTLRNSLNDEKEPCNFLIQSVYSLHWRMLFDTPRFAINDGKPFSQDGKTYNVQSPLSVTLWGNGPVWGGNLPAFEGMILVNSEGQEYGCYHSRMIEYFEYEDKIAGIGFVHMLYQPFTAEETLLCRAEAKLYLGDQAGALQDLNYWTTSHLCTKTLTLDAVKTFYSNSRNIADGYVSALHPAEMGFEQVLTGDARKVLDCILHFRRITTVHNGDRWFDIKRYGITVTHYYRSPSEYDVHIDSLTWNDPRRVLQLPRNVIDAGYPSNRGEQNAIGGASQGYKVSVIKNPKFNFFQ